MELDDVKAGRYYDIIPGNTGTPWYTRYKRTIWAIIAVTVIVVTIAIITISVRCTTCQHHSPTVEYMTVSPPLEWEGNCPKAPSSCPPSFQSNPPLLLISLDGLQNQYLSRGISPTLSKLAKCGVSADYMFPVYPTKTFPNHYSIVTGMYPAYHGILDNSMYDADMRRLFKVGKTKIDDSRWWQKEPLWVTAQKQGKKTATYFWPGSDVKINGSYPTIYKKYNKSIPFESRVEQVLKWIESPNRPDFITLYLHEPDGSGHDHGPFSQEVDDALRRVDKMVEKLFAGLQNRNLIDCVNVLIVSDHGMSQIECNRTLNIENYVNISEFHSFLGPFGRLRPKNKSVSVDSIIERFQCQDNHMRVYRKEELPVRMHFVENPRIEPVILLVDAGWSLVKQDESRWCSGGSHGYDNISPDMRAIFIAQGPSLKKNTTIQPFVNIELYELMCEMIGINPNPNNGTRGSLHAILKNPRLISEQKIPSTLKPALLPLNEVEVQARLNASNCSCFPVPQEESDLEELKNQSSVHLPFGAPQSPYDNVSAILYNSDYVTAFNSILGYPLWTTFTLTGKENSSESVICWSGDARVPNALCLPPPEGFLQRPLYHPGFSDQQSQAQAFYVTNSVLKFLNHTTNLEEEMNNITQKVAETKGPLNVMTGPAFDSISINIHQDFEINKTNDSPSIPTHIFYILTWCSEEVSDLNDCPTGSLAVQSFVLPNFPYPNNCESAEDVIKRNVARVADIEKVTSISFYSGLPIHEAIRLRTFMPLLTY